MDILVITWNFPPKRGGMEQLLGSLCERLKKNHSVFVIACYANEPPPHEREVFRPPWPGLLLFFIYALYRGSLLLFRQPTIEAVFGGSALVTPLVLVLARLFGRKAVIQAHGLDLIYANPFYQAVIVQWLKYCDHVITNSSYTASLAKEKGVAEASVTVIPPGIDCERFALPLSADVLKRKQGLEGKKVILFVGRLARRKGVKQFIEESLVTIVREIPETCFLIVGDNPNESLTHHDDVLSEIRGVISACHFQEHVKWLGGVSDDELIKLYNLCDLLVLPALVMKGDVEGFGIVALEAAAAGKPVVATGVGGIPDAVEDGKGGIVTEPGDYNALSQAVISLLSEREKKAAMGEYARRRVKEKFSWQVILANYQSVFEGRQT